MYAQNEHTNETKRQHSAEEEEDDDEKKMYQRKHSIDNINWMIMVGQSTRIEINFDELTAAMGFRN